MSNITLTTGFESGENTGTLSGTATIQSVVKRTGSNALSATANGAGGNNTQISMYPTDFAYVDITTYIRMGALPDGNDVIFGLFKSNLNPQVLLYVTTGGVLTAEDQEGGSFSGTTGLSLNTWYKIRVVYDARNVTTKRICNIYIDDSLFATCTDGQFSTMNYLTLGEDILGNALTTGTFYHDDIEVKMLNSKPAMYRHGAVADGMGRSEGWT